MQSSQDDVDGKIVLEKVCESYNVMDYREYFGLKYTYNDQKSKQEVVRNFLLNLKF